MFAAKPKHIMARMLFSPLWGLLWGCSFKLLVVRSGMESNAARIDLGGGPRLSSAKVATVSKIAQCVGTLSNVLNGFFLMDLRGC